MLLNLHERCPLIIVRLFKYFVHIYDYTSIHIILHSLFLENLQKAYNDYAFITKNRTLFLYCNQRKIGLRCLRIDQDVYHSSWSPVQHACMVIKYVYGMHYSLHNKYSDLLHGGISCKVDCLLLLNSCIIVLR